MVACHASLQPYTFKMRCDAASSVSPLNFPSPSTVMGSLVTQQVLHGNLSMTYIEIQPMLGVQAAR